MNLSFLFFEPYLSLGMWERSPGVILPFIGTPRDPQVLYNFLLKFHNSPFPPSLSSSLPLAAIFFLPYLWSLEEPNIYWLCLYWTELKCPHNKCLPQPAPEKQERKHLFNINLKVNFFPLFIFLLFFLHFFFLFFNIFSFLLIYITT